MYADPAALIPMARQQLITRRIQSDLSMILDVLGDAAIAGHPWLLLHQGRRYLRRQSDFARAQPYIEAALAEFRMIGDDEGMIWAMTEWVVLRYHLRDFSFGLEQVRQLLNDERAIPWFLPFLQAELLFGCYLCLIGLDRLDEAMAAGAEALALLDTEPDAWLQRIGRIQMLRNIAAGYHYQGQARQAVAATELATRLAQEDPDASDPEPWCHYEMGLAYWRKGEFVLAAQALDTARRQAEYWGHHQLWCWAVAVQGHLLRDQNELAAAREAYQLAESWGEDIHGPVFLFIREGKLAEARWSCQALLSQARQLGSVIYEADAYVLTALIELRAGRVALALDHLDQAITIFATHGYGYNLMSAQLYRTAALLSLQRFDEADATLAEGMELMACEEIYTCDWWMPDVLELVMLRALQRRIQPIHARRVLNRRFLNAVPALATIMTQSIRSNPLNTELEIARQTQVSLLPTTPPHMPDLDIAGVSLPAEEVGGDFYGYYPVGADPAQARIRQVGLALADISGKGLQAALLTSGTVVALTTAVVDHPPPSQILERVHTALYPFTSRSRQTVSLCYGILSQGERSWTLRVANAGAIPPFIRRTDGSITWLESMGLPLGTAQAMPYTEVVAELAPGDLLLLISDGVVEAMSTDRELFGFERLEEALAYAPVEQGAGAVVAHLLTSVQAHTANALQHDDITVVAVLVQSGTIWDGL